VQHAQSVQHPGALAPPPRGRWHGLAGPAAYSWSHSVLRLERVPCAVWGSMRTIGPNYCPNGRIGKVEPHLSLDRSSGSRWPPGSSQKVQMLQYLYHKLSFLAWARSQIGEGANDGFEGFHGGFAALNYSTQGSCTTHIVTMAAYLQFRAIEKYWH
jgi:hypothetical protein